jgi:hypothetical protein
MRLSAVAVPKKVTSDAESRASRKSLLFIVSIPPEYVFGPCLRSFRKPKVRLRRGRRRNNPDSLNASEIRVVFRGEPFVNALDASPVPVDEVFAAGDGRLAGNNLAQPIILG